MGWIWTARTLCCGAVALSTLAAPVQLRYRLRANDHWRMCANSSVVTTQEFAGKTTTVGRFTSSAQYAVRVASASRQAANVEFNLTDGRQKVEAGALVQTAVIDPQTTRVTLTSTGRCLKVSRLPGPGTPAPKPQFGDGLVIELPAAPVAPGTTWKGRQAITGLEGKSFPVEVASRVRSIEKRQGHPCVCFTSRLGSRFTATNAETGAAAEGILTGEADTCFATDLGTELSCTTKMTLVVTPKAAVGPSGERPVTTTHFEFTQRRLP